MKGPWEQDRQGRLREKTDALLTQMRGYLPSADFISLSEVIQELKTHQTELERQNEELRSAQVELADSHRRFREFLANMSHEIRTPLSGIVGTANLLIDSELDGKQLEYCRILNRSAESLREIVDEILDFSKIEAGHMEVIEGDFDLHEVCADLEHMLSMRAAERQIGFRLRVDPQIPRWLHGDAGKFRRILLNLAVNAVKFTMQGEVSVKILPAGKTPDRLCIRGVVSDTGIGIPPESLGHLFKPFAQVDSPLGRRQVGTGLGLAICKSMVELLGGVIEVESKEGRGSVFSFTALFAEAHREGSFRSERPVPSTGGRKKGRILVAEDHPINQKLLTRLLEIHGYDADVVENGRRVLERLRSGDYDLVLMDMQMPDMDGLEATRLIREGECPENGRIPIVALTANVLPGDRERCLNSGMDGYLAKPVKSDELVEMLTRFLSPKG